MIHNSLNQHSVRNECREFSNQAMTRRPYERKHSSPCQPNAFRMEGVERDTEFTEIHENGAFCWSSEIVCDKRAFMSPCSDGRDQHFLREEHHKQKWRESALNDGSCAPSEQLMTRTVAIRSVPFHQRACIPRLLVLIPQQNRLHSLNCPFRLPKSRV